METPGLHKPTTKLSGHMLKAVKDAVADIDAVLFVQDCTKPLSEQEEELLRSLEKAKTPTILVLNKMDQVPEDEREARKADIVARLNWQGPVYVVSAISRDGTCLLYTSRCV